MPRKKQEIKTLKPIRNNIAIERKLKKALQGFTKELLKSVTYWSVAQVNKFTRGDLTNISVALRVEFNDLLKAWNKKANKFSKRISQSVQRDIVTYVNSNLKEQSLKPIKSNNNVKNALKADVLQNISLIKTIPQDIIEKYQVLLYNNILTLNQQGIIKAVKEISNISLSRANTIARDQVAKSIENYKMAQCNALGFDYYVWNTSRDERVSKGNGGHIHLHNRIYRYDNPTAIIDSKGTLGKPAQRVNCRCIATPLILDYNQDVKLVKDSQAGDYYIVIDKV